QGPRRRGPDLSARARTGVDRGGVREPRDPELRSVRGRRDALAPAAAEHQREPADATATRVAARGARVGAFAIALAIIAAGAAIAAVVTVAALSRIRADGHRQRQVDRAEHRRAVDELERL